MAIKYIPFFPDPIQGQAVLDNFKRTLKYKGSGDVEGKLRRGMPFYEVETQETVGANPDGNLVIRGECVSACAYLKDKGIKVDLVYIDPPFASGADYAKKIYIRRNPKVAEAIAKAEEELEDDCEDRSGSAHGVVKCHWRRNCLGRTTLSTQSDDERPRTQVWVSFVNQ